MNEDNEPTLENFILSEDNLETASRLTTDEELELQMQEMMELEMLQRSRLSGGGGGASARVVWSGGSRIGDTVRFRMPTFSFDDYVPPKPKNKYRMFDNAKVDIIRGRLLVGLTNQLFNKKTKYDDCLVKKYLCRYAQLDGATALKTTDDLFVQTLGELLTEYKGNDVRLEKNDSSDYWAPVAWLKAKHSINIPLEPKDGMNNRYEHMDIDKLQLIDVLSTIMESSDVNGSNKSIRDEAYKHAKSNVSMFNNRYFILGYDGEVQDMDRNMFNTLVVLLNRNLFLPHLVRTFDNATERWKKANKYIEQINQDVKNARTGKRIFQFDNRTIANVKKQLGDDMPKDGQEFGDIMQYIEGVMRENYYDEFMKNIVTEFKKEQKRRGEPKPKKGKKGV